MRGFKRVILVLSILLIVLICVAFVLENQQPVALSFIGWSTPQVPVSLCISGSLLVGMIIGPILGILTGRKKMAIRAH